MKNKIPAKTWLKTGAAAGMLLLIALYYACDLNRYFTLENFKAERDVIALYYAQNPVLTVFGYFLLYVLITALFLPLGLFLTLAGGAIFGAVKATAFISLAAATGATVAFLIARFLFRDWVERKFGGRLKPVHAGFARNALSFMLFLRIVPFPFAVVNLAAGVTQVRLRTFYFGTVLGIMPATFIFANVGSRLAAIHTLADAVAPQSLAALALLGALFLLPAAYKRFAAGKNGIGEVEF